MPTLVTDPEIIRRVREAAGKGQTAPTASPTGGRVVTDPKVIEAVKNRSRFNAAAAKKRQQILEAGQNMPEAPDRIAQAFDVASDPIADQSLRPDYNQYGFTENVLRSLPFGDEVGSGGAALSRYLAGKSGFDTEVGLGEQYERQRALDRAEQERYARQNPAANVGGQVLGIAAGGAPTGAAAAFGVRAAPAAVKIPATVGGRVAEGVKAGVPLGALYGAGEGEGLQERAVNAATGAVGGGAVGAALPVAGGVARSARRLYGGYDPAIGGHVQRLKQESQGFYKEMERQGVQLAGPSFQRIAQNVAVKARQEGIDKGVNPKAAAALERLLSDAGAGGKANAIPTLEYMETLRKVLRNSGKGADGDPHFAQTMVDAFDEQLNRLRPSDIAAGNPRAGLEAVRQGRQLWKQHKKAEAIDNILETARDKVGANYTQSGLQTAIRQEFRALNKRIREKKTGGWTNAERLLINRIVRGGSGENVFRLLGRFAIRGPWTGGASAGAAYFIDPMLGAGLAVGGEVGKRISTARGIRQVEKLDDLIAHGPQGAPRQLGPWSQRAGQGRRFLVEQGAGWSPQMGLGDQLLRREQ